jgi:hypothetical protein
MKTHIVIAGFARKYGVKEGLVLTELCRRMQISGTAAIPFSVSLGKQHFPYLTEKQLRLSLKRLREQGCKEVPLAAAGNKRRIRERTAGAFLTGL